MHQEFKQLKGYTMWPTAVSFDDIGNFTHGLAKTVFDS